MATREIVTVSPSPNAVEVFCSYSHRDQALREDLETHLRPLQAKGLIYYWHDHAIPAGDDWESRIDERLNSAQLFLLLVSPDFMASRHCQIEMQRALERRKEGKARVIPILLRHVDRHNSPLGKIQALPKDGRPITTWPDRDQAFKDITIGVRRVAEKLARGDTLGIPHITDSSLVTPPPALPRRGNVGGKVVIATVIMLFLAAAVYFGKHQLDLARLRDRNWTAAKFDDPDFFNCMGVQSCETRREYASRLQAMDWSVVKYDLPVLNYCRALPACVERANQAEKLKSIKNWSRLGLADRGLLKDCMGNPDCLRA